jgi:hypothetical protein
MKNEPRPPSDNSGPSKPDRYRDGEKDMTVKPIEDFVPPINGCQSMGIKMFAVGLSVCLLCLALLVVTVVSFFLHDLTLLSHSVFIWLIGTGAFLLIAGGGLVSVGRSAQLHGCKASYSDYLGELDPSQLVAALASPKIDERSQSAITGFLNEHHFDWSVDDSGGQAGVF